MKAASSSICSRTGGSHLPRICTGSASCKRSTMLEIIYLPSRRRQKPAGFCRSRHPIVSTSTLRNIASMARSRVRRVAIRLRQTSDLNNLKCFALIINSSRRGPRTARRILVNRAALIGAEIARLEGRDADAMRLYEQAIRSAPPLETGYLRSDQCCAVDQISPGRPRPTSGAVL